MQRILLLAALVCAPWLLAADEPGTPDNPAEAVISAEEGERLLARLDDMRAEIEEILGMIAARDIPRSLISRDEINTLVAERLEESASPEEMRQEELFLRLFGFVEEDFDLAGEVVDVMTEQATALYDFKTKMLYLASWTPDDMQEFALVHELAHAIADKYFNLEKYIKKGKTADADLARSAVVEGQASWVMTEYVMRQAGRSMLEEKLLAVQAAAASRFEVQDYPVYNSSPLYLRETMLFPYTDGLLFQQALVERLGKRGFFEPFETAPLSTQQILHPETYFQDRRPTEPKLPDFNGKSAGFKRASHGEIGELEHRILIEQYENRDLAAEIGPTWRGGRYEIWENETKTRAVLRYASEWETPEAARRFYDLYRGIAGERRGADYRVIAEEEDRTRAEGPEGRIEIALDGSTVTSLEGLPADSQAASR